MTRQRPAYIGEAHHDKQNMFGEEDGENTDNPTMSEQREVQSFSPYDGRASRDHSTRSLPSCSCWGHSWFVYEMIALRASDVARFYEYNKIESRPGRRFIIWQSAFVIYIRALFRPLPNVSTYVFPGVYLLSAFSFPSDFFPIPVFVYILTWLISNGKPFHQ